MLKTDNDLKVQSNEKQKIRYETDVLNLLMKM